MVVVLCLVQHWKTIQCLVRFEFLAKATTAKEVAHELINALSIKLGIGSEYLVAAMRDRPSVNNVAPHNPVCDLPTLVGCGMLRPHIRPSQ